MTVCCRNTAPISPPPRRYRVYLNVVARIVGRTPISTEAIAMRMATKHVRDGGKQMQDNSVANLDANRLQNHLRAVQWEQKYVVASWRESSQSSTKLYSIAPVECCVYFSHKGALRYTYDIA